MENINISELINTIVVMGPSFAFIISVILAMLGKKKSSNKILLLGESLKHSQIGMLQMADAIETYVEESKNSSDVINPNRIKELVNNRLPTDSKAGEMLNDILIETGMRMLDEINGKKVVSVNSNNRQEKAIINIMNKLIKWKGVNYVVEP